MSVTFDNGTVSPSRGERVGDIHRDVYVVTETGKLCVSRENVEHTNAHTQRNLERMWTQFDNSAAAMPSSVLMIDSGKNLLAAVCVDGTLWTWSPHPGHTSDFHHVLCRPVGDDADGNPGASNGGSSSTPRATQGTPATMPGMVSRSMFEDESVVQVCCGHRSMVVLTETGRVWIVNQNTEVFDTVVEEGELKFQPGQNKICMVAKNCHYSPLHDHFIALDMEGGVWTWGRNDEGACGYTGQSNLCTPRRVRHCGHPVSMVAAGGSTSAAVTANGFLYLWGTRYNTASTLPGHIPDCISMEVFNNKKVRTISCAQFYMLIVTEDGVVWSLCDGLRARDALTEDAVLLFWDPVSQPVDDLFMSSDLKPFPSHLFGGKKIVACKAGVSSSAVVTEDGALYVWGAVVNTSTPTLVPTQGPLHETVKLWSFDYTNPQHHDLISQNRMMALLQSTHARLGVLSDHMKDIPTECFKQMCICSDNYATYHATKTLSHGTRWDT